MNTTTGHTELRVVTTAGWLARDLAGGTSLPVVHDLGLDVPADTTGTAWWAPHRFVARLAVTPGVTQPQLTSPGPAWMSTVPRELLGRRVWTGRLEDAGSAGWGGPVFGKVAEVKLNRLPAAVWPDAAAFIAAATAAGVDQASPVVLAEPVEFTAEFRCFIGPGAGRRPVVRASSAYLVAGQTWDAWSSSDAPDTAAAVAFAGEVLDVVDGPAGWVLDVGQLTGGAWAVVEANAAWSANPYHCDSTGVVAAVLAAQDGTSDRRWAWGSDPTVDRYARPLPVRRR